MIDPWSVPFQFIMKLNINIPDFEQYTSDQQFVNVVGALDHMETQVGGLTVEEIWEMAWQVVDGLKSSRRPDATAHRLQSLISTQLSQQMPDRTPEQVLHSTHCVLFCVNYLLCANDEEPDPNQQVIDNISKALAKMTDIVELFNAVEQEEDDEEARGHSVESRNVLSEEVKPEAGKWHDMQEGDQLILSRLEEFINKSFWINGATAKAVKDGMWKALGMGELGLSTENLKLSNQLWALFRKRKYSDANDSFRITWLNFVGWCVRQRMLDGASPQLCKEYYPRLGNDEYKAIDKGRTGGVAAFVKIEPLLEMYVKTNITTETETNDE